MQNRYLLPTRKEYPKRRPTMPKNFTYADAGVNRQQRAESKKALKTLKETYKYSKFGEVMHLPYGNIFPINQNAYLDLVIEGVAKGAAESECPVTGGEIGDVAEVIKGIAEGKGFDMIIAAVGQVSKQDVITGKNIKPDGPIIGLSSTGLHSE